MVTEWDFDGSESSDEVLMAMKNVLVVEAKTKLFE